MQRNRMLMAFGAALIPCAAACGSGDVEPGGAVNESAEAHHGFGGYGWGWPRPSSSSSGGHAASSSSSGGHTASSSSSSTSSSSSSSSGAASSSSSTSSSSSSSGSAGGWGLFQATEPWSTPVDTATLDPSSSAIIQWLSSAGGWGTGQMQIDFSINLLYADASTPFETFNPTSSFYTPDCDDVPFPVPAGGAVEREPGYACTGGGDCHLLVVDPLSNELYEMWQADIEGSTFNGGCVAVWDLLKAYPPNLRGDGCTSADAGGFPISAMLFTADEVAAGAIPHAIRFILPNSRIRHETYVHPGTHTTSATSGGSDAPPYGVHLRLRADYPLSSLSAGAQVVAKAMQTYGLFLADGGEIALTAANDQFTTHKWADVGIDALSLSAIQVTDMEVVEMGATYTTLDCTRNP